jgi:hypothetical protein
VTVMTFVHAAPRCRAYAMLRRLYLKGFLRKGCVIVGQGEVWSLDLGEAFGFHLMRNITWEERSELMIG